MMWNTYIRLSCSIVNFQEEALKTNLQVLQSDLAASDEARTGLETLNLQLEETNTKLKQQYLEVKVSLTIRVDLQETCMAFFRTHFHCKDSINCSENHFIILCLPQVLL